MWASETRETTETITELPVPFEVPLCDPAGVHVEVPPRSSPDLDGVEARARVVAAYLDGRDRAYGELVSDADRVTVRCLGFGAAGPVPFTARSHLVLEAGASDELPGAWEHIIGATVGNSVTYVLDVPDDLEGQPLAGQQIHMVVEILSARAPREGVPSARALDAARAQVLAHHERAEDAELHHAVLTALMREHPVAVPRELINQRVTEMWEHVEGPVLARLEIPYAEQEVLFEAWLTNPDIRRIAGATLATTALVAAFGNARGVKMNAKAAARRIAVHNTELPEKAREEVLSAALFGELELCGLDAHWLRASLDLLVDEALR